MAIDYAGFGAGFAADVASGAIGQGIGYGYTAKAASTAWDRQKNMLTRGPSYMMQGLEKAGLNPILAVNNLRLPGASMAPQAGNPTSAVSMNRYGQQALLKAQTNAAEATTQRQLAAASLDMIRGELEGMDAPRRAALAEWFRSDEGREWARQNYINESMPNTWQGVLMKLLMGQGVIPTPDKGKSTGERWYIDKDE